MSDNADTDLKQNASRIAALNLAAAAESAEAEEPEARLPRLLRHALASRASRPYLRERLLGEIAHAAPDLEEAGAIWAADPADHSSQFARTLDARAVEADQTMFRAFADCVRLLGISDRPEHIPDQRRVAAALAASVSEVSIHVAADVRAKLEEIVIGWALVASRIADSSDSLAVDVAGCHGRSRLQWIVQAAIAREQAEQAREREEVAARAAEEAAKSSGDDAGKRGEPAAEGYVRVCDLAGEDITAKRLKDLVGGHEPVIGQDVPLAATPDIGAVRSQLAFEFPYATDVIDRVLQDLIGQPTIHLRPTLLVGLPGGGKSRFARRLGDVLGAGVWRADASQGDGAVFGGTARRWHSAEPCHPFLAISRARFANPTVVIDELEKAGTRSDYGRLWDCLLGLLEPETAARYPDPALQTNLDLSRVGYVATANSIEPLPAPLRDRLRIIEFPTPSADDIDSLLPPLVGDYARERGVDARWIAPLTLGERDLVAAHWGGGSVRRLKRFVEVVLAERERATLRQ